MTRSKSSGTQAVRKSSLNMTFKNDVCIYIFEIQLNSAESGRHICLSTNQEMWRSICDE